MNVKMDDRSVSNLTIPIQVTVLDMHVSEFSPQWHLALNEEGNIFVDRCQQGLYIPHRIIRKARIVKTKCNSASIRFMQQGR